MQGRRNEIVRAVHNAVFNNPDAWGDQIFWQAIGRPANMSAGRWIVE